jgi:hypothetical protein
VPLGSLAVADTAKIVCTMGGKSVSADVCLAALRTQASVASTSSKKPTAAIEQSATTTTSRLPPLSPLANSKPPETGKPYNSWHWENTFLVRNSKDDLGSFNSPSSLKKATGAEFSWARDRVVGNDTWTARGLVAERLFGWEEPSLSPYVAHALIAPYVVFDRVSNTTKKTNDVNDLTGGISAEVAFANFLQATHYFRLMAEEDSDFEGHAKNWNVALEYQPFGNPSMEQSNSIFAYLGTPLPLGPYFFLTITPKLHAEYRSSQDGSIDPIFAVHDHALRVGPSVTATVSGNSLFDDVPWYIQRTHLRVTYGALYDLSSSKNYPLLDTALTYDLDPHGYLGLTLSYRKGKLETTGASVDLAKVSLSGKFGE